MMMMYEGSPSKFGAASQATLLDSTSVCHRFTEPTALGFYTGAPLQSEDKEQSLLNDLVSENLNLWFWSLACEEGMEDGSRPVGRSHRNKGSERQQILLHYKNGI
jgi:hypothetical protein